MVSAAFEGHNAYRSSFDKLIVESKFENNSNRADMIIYTNDFIIIIEFKQIDPNALYLPNHKFRTYVELNKILKEMKEDNLEKIEIRPDQRNNYKNCDTIEQLVIKAEKQVKEYVRIVIDEEKNLKQRPVCAFVVVQVGWPVIVKDVSN